MKLKHNQIKLCIKRFLKFDYLQCICKGITFSVKIKLFWKPKIKCLRYNVHFWGGGEKFRWEEFRWEKFRWEKDQSTFNFGKIRYDLSTLDRTRLHFLHARPLHIAHREIIWFKFSIWWKFWLLDKWATVKRRKVTSCKKLGWGLVIYQGIVNHQYKHKPARVAQAIRLCIENYINFWETTTA